jgi:restriction endonuclease S subunit
MGSERRKMSLRDAGVVLLDCDHKTPKAIPIGIPYIAIPQMKKGRIDLSDVRHISNEDYESWTRKTKPEAYDIVLSRRCNPGETVFIPEGLKCAIGQNLVVLRTSGIYIDKKFLRWLVQGEEWWQQIRKYINAGAVFDSLRCRDVPSFELTIPPLPAQKAIACILGTLDDKIELLRQMNETFEAMAWALFKSWFIDFDPVRNKAEGKPTGLPPEIDQLFPDSFMDSELGEIPKGWKIDPIRTLVAEITERVNNQQGVPVFSAINTGDLVLSDSYFTKRVYSEKIEKYKLIKHGDFAYNPSRINIGSIGILESNDVGAVSPIYSAFRVPRNFRAFFRYLIISPSIKEMIGQLCSGSVRQSLSFRDFSSIKYVFPDEKIAQYFDTSWAGLDVLKKNSNGEIKTLIEIRDANSLNSSQVNLNSQINQYQKYWSQKNEFEAYRIRC